MNLDEIMAKARSIYDHVEEINTLGEARQAVKDAASMMFYLAKHVAEYQQANKSQIDLPKAGSFHD